ncbi:FKBP-type peptidyl-prolyl cis-trans isomerase [Sphingopyxis sp. 113P3]|jgi:FKBP-type peptidyl-prolyl cis-trans isomerases 1|uniref:FKBP-type peptidyl-prolyl cis-trans isomerase n=1 Tax=Sphingopyxis sp. (strain 113P3) TaxID=292913 RepID=UPI0006AD1562|nr:FKBP-type peptidyl-prolyl cis-trans isomerase [Sphingopyxis sp. 113P3]ALC12199.1 peptidylprolyl isomerase [Sphingopyxis sp. 113P3]
MSVTTVPLRPVSKGGLWLLWIGLAALAAVAIAFAVRGTPRIGFEVVKEGTGASPTQSDIVLVKYQGKLDDGTVFDANEQAPMQVAQVVPGFSEALTRMKKGGEYKITIPPQLGYGDRAVGPIPAGSTLHFDVTLIDFRSEAEVRAMQQMMQQQQMMQGAPGGPGGPPSAAPQP